MKHLPTFIQLKENQIQNSLICKDENFIYIPDNQLFICLTTIQNKKFMT